MRLGKIALRDLMMNVERESDFELARLDERNARRTNQCEDGGGRTRET